MVKERFVFMGNKYFRVDGEVFAECENCAGGDAYFFRLNQSCEVCDGKNYKGKPLNLEKSFYVGDRGDWFMKVGDRGYARGCGRCSGRGFDPMKWRSFNGQCFKCAGSGHEEVRWESIEKLEKYVAQLNKSRAKADAKREEERLVALAKWEREQAQRDAVEAERKAVLDKWVHVDAQVGEQVELEGEVLYVGWFDNQWGGSYLVVVAVGENREVKFNSNAKWVGGLEKGDHIKFVAEVKSHGEYQGKKQSILGKAKQR